MQQLGSKAPVGLTIMEKLIGLIMIAVGAITLYATYLNIASLPEDPLIFLATGIILIVVGTLLLIAQTE